MSIQKRTPNGKKKKKFNPIVTFLKIVVSIVLIFCVAATGAAFAYYKATGSSKKDAIQENKPSLVEALMKKGIKLNVAVFGVDDDGTRTDVMFVVHFDSKDKKTSIISLPRDTRVSIVDSVRQKLNAEGRYYQSPTKLNAVHSYSGKEMGADNTVLQIEDLLGISIDHYIKVDLKAFRKIVDTIGGVEVDVPRDMYYMDPVQNLSINLKAGVQTLNGDKAEQLVRFRSYKQGDLERVKVQQMFLKEFAKKVLSSETILKNLPDYISTLYSDIETNITMGDALKYVNYIKRIDVNNMTMETIPGVAPKTVGPSYYLYDVEGTRELVDRVFYGIGEEGIEDGTSKAKAIEVSNGGTVAGLAAKTAENLKKDGYHVTGVATYNGEKNDYTRIVVKEKGVGEDLKKYFTDSRIQVDASLLSAETDIKIILGLKEK